jgi:hypothetical protein
MEDKLSFRFVIPTGIVTSYYFALTLHNTRMHWTSTYTLVTIRHQRNDCMWCEFNYWINYHTSVPTDYLRKHGNDASGAIKVGSLSICHGRSCADVESAASRPRDFAILCIFPPAIVAWCCCYFRHSWSLSSLKPPSSALIHFCTATGRIFYSLDEFTALRFTAAGVPPAARRKRILSMNQPITFRMKCSN